MSTGTKVFLAVFAGFVGILVLYYGVLMPDPDHGVALRPVEPQALSDAGSDPLAASLQRSVNDPADTNAPQQPVATPQPIWTLASTSESNMASDGAVSPGVVPLGDSAAEAEAPHQEPTAASGVTDPATGAAAPTVISQPIANHAISLPDATSSEAVRPVGASSPPVTSRPAKPQTPPRSVSTTEYIVKSGDTMSSIAEAWFGDRNKWSLIARENPLEDPHRLRVGQRLRLPPKDATASNSGSTTPQDRSKPAPASSQKTSTSPKGAVYTVRSGDTLAQIAREHYNDVAKWEAIYQANRDVIGSDPSRLQPGMKLRLPATS